jgi:hypothetical protein
MKSFQLKHMTNEVLNGLVQIHPKIDYETNSPDGTGIARALEWAIPGPWILARCETSTGLNPFYTELPWSMGVQAPISIDEHSGNITSAPTQAWRSTLIQESWHNKTNTSLKIEVDVRRPVQSAILINCLFPWWADAISILWRVNQLNHSELAKLGIGIVALISPDLKWLLPPEIDEAWIVPASQVSANIWNKSLDIKLHELVANLHSCYIPRLFQPARATVEQVKAITGITPFPRVQWIDRLIEKPTVTFMYRPDRCWGSNQVLINQIFNLIPKKLTLIRQLIQSTISKYYLLEQKKNIVKLAKILRKTFVDIEFSIAGTNTEIPFPNWFVDIRADNPGEKSNRASAVQCSRSHLMICVAGSHMYLPSAFSGGTIMILPYPEWVDFQTGYLLTSKDPCEAQFLYRTLSETSTPQQVAELAISILINYPIQNFVYNQNFEHPLNSDELSLIRNVNKKRHLLIERIKNKVNLDILRV